ncbi:hypothetical protein RDI58_026828 [Solanum bulbocastanum]|uniref:Uncharacterized protein n=1 Tax=Solanum bulbocastanum TaxID=147425 RepID=A0AAN8Y1T7_SOLBU
MNPVAYLSHSTPTVVSQQRLPDTRLTYHISPDLTTFHQIEYYKGPDQVHVGNGNSIPIHHTGNATLHSVVLFHLNNGNGNSIPIHHIGNATLSSSLLFLLNNILHVPLITE